MRRRRNPDGFKDCHRRLPSFLVLECLKPISESKIRRELIVLAHCTRQRLPNLARLIGVVLPDSMDKDGNEADDGHASRDLGREGGGEDDYLLMRIMNDRNELSLSRQKAAVMAALDRRKR